MATVAHGRIPVRNESDVCVHDGRSTAIALDAAAHCAGVSLSIGERTRLVSQMAETDKGVAFKGVGFAAK